MPASRDERRDRYSLGSAERGRPRVGRPVTSFTASDFGRTLAGNGNGTDHGWGGHAFVFGGAVAGGLAGTFPSYASVGNADDASTEGDFAARLIPTTSVNQSGATLARWMGVEDVALDGVFPDLANFAARDLGLFRERP